MHCEFSKILLKVLIIFRGAIQQGLVPVGKACAVQVDAVVHHMLSDAVEGIHQVYSRFADFLVVFPGSGDPLVDGAAGHDAGIAVGDGLQKDGGVGANLLHKRPGSGWDPLPGRINCTAAGCPPRPPLPGCWESGTRRCGGRSQIRRRRPDRP